jgi:hypothetical protein
MRLVQERKSMTKPTEKTDVGTFAAVINSRLAAQAHIAKAIGFAWMAGGVAIASSLTALGAFSALYGYSYMISIKPAAEQVANALVQALERTQLKTTVSGTMSLAPGSELRLAQGQTVKLDEGSIVKLDPNSLVRVTVTDVPQPSNEQLGFGTRKPNTDELRFTSYTIFRQVDYASGAVVTAWHYDLTDRTRPKSQHCYYRVVVDDGLSAKYVIAYDGIPQRPSTLDKVKFEGAVANCIWFTGA